MMGATVDDTAVDKLLGGSVDKDAVDKLVGGGVDKDAIDKLVGASDDEDSVDKTVGTSSDEDALEALKDDLIEALKGQEFDGVRKAYLRVLNAVDEVSRFKSYEGIFAHVGIVEKEKNHFDDTMEKVVAINRVKEDMKDKHEAFNKVKFEVVEDPSESKDFQLIYSV